MENEADSDNFNHTLDDHRDLNYTRISSWKFMKAKKGGVYVIYPVHVFMKSGLHWTIDKVESLSDYRMYNVFIAASRDTLNF